jgi:hypothetical protein
LGTRFTVLSALFRRYGLAVYVTRHSLASEGGRNWGGSYFGDWVVLHFLAVA